MTYNVSPRAQPPKIIVAMANNPFAVLSKRIFFFNIKSEIVMRAKTAAQTSTSHTQEWEHVLVASSKAHNPNTTVMPSIMLDIKE